MLALIIEEAGIRKLPEAAPLIVEYCAFDEFHDHVVHLLPRALQALESIGDKIVIPRLEEIGLTIKSENFGRMLRLTIERLNRDRPQ